MRHHAVMGTVAVIAAASQLACSPGAQQEPPQQQPEQQPEQQPPTDAQRQPPAGAPTLVTDSTQYTVRFEHGMYRARIGFTYTNRSADAVSMNYCRTPTPPILEKRVGDQWVRAYSAVVLACLTLPPFRIAPGATYHGALDLAAAPRGRNTAPALEVESVPGTYRLRWSLRAGSDPDTGAPAEAISNEFRLVEG